MEDKQVILTYYHSLNHQEFMDSFKTEEEYSQRLGTNAENMFSDSHLVVDSNRPGLKALKEAIVVYQNNGYSVFLVCNRLTDLCVGQNYAEWLEFLKNLRKRGVVVGDYTLNKVIINAKSKATGIEELEEFYRYQNRPISFDRKKDVKRAVYQDHAAGLSYSKLAQKYGFSSRTAINYVKAVRQHPDFFNVSTSKIEKDYVNDN